MFMKSRFVVLIIEFRADRESDLVFKALQYSEFNTQGFLLSLNTLNPLHGLCRPRYRAQDFKDPIQPKAHHP